MKTFGENTIELLNAGVDDFYSYKFDFINDSKVIEFKAMFITFINQIERVFKGVFGKAFRLDDQEDIDLFKELFPVIYEAASKNKKEGLDKLCSILSTFRNLNAHACCGCNYSEELDAKFILEKLPNYNPDVRYWTDSNIPTLAGMITLLFFLSNDSGIKCFVKHDVWEGFVEKLNYFGKGHKPNLFDFPEEVMKINKVNDEIYIRRTNNSDSVLSAIFGRFVDKIVQADDKYCYRSGTDFEDASFGVCFTLDKTSKGYHLMVEENSNYHVHFASNFVLDIIDVDGFIDMCNKVPPFMFVVYLYRAGIKTYTKESLNEKQKELVLKLNKPKFYVDKNVDTLLLSESVSDVRLGGQVVSTGINYCIYRFELSAFGKKPLADGNYSSIRQSLRRVGIPREVGDKIVAIRNFFSHHYIIGDSHAVGDGSATIDIEYVVLAFNDFINSLKKIDERRGNAASNDFFFRVICNIILFKYVDMLKKSERFIRNPNETDYVAIYKAINRIKNSFITDRVEQIIKGMYPNNTFNIYKDKLLYLNKCVINSSAKLQALNGYVFKGPITLITSREIKPKEFLCVNFEKLISNRKNGFIVENVWGIE